MNKNVLFLIIGISLIGLGLLQPNSNNAPTPNKPSVIAAPVDDNLKQACDEVILLLRAGDKNDALKLSGLYKDIARLIELDGADTVIKTTEDIKWANSLSGLMLRMDLKGKYPGLAESAKKVIVAGIGDDAIMLDANVRAKAVEAFMALSWACNEGAK